MTWRLIIGFLVLSIAFNVFAEKNLPIPRFVTIKFNEVNVRTGPAADCPIEWVYVKKGEPVEIVAEYDQWRKIRDMKGEGGWVQAHSLAAARSVVIVAKDTTPLLAKPEKYDMIVAKLSSGLRCGLKRCENDWCQLYCGKHKGWVPKKYLWGVYPEELF